MTTNNNQPLPFLNTLDSNIESIIIKVLPSRTQFHKLNKLIKQQVPGLSAIRFPRRINGKRALSVLSLPRIQPHKVLLGQIKDIFPSSTILIVYRGGMDPRKLEDEVDSKAHKELIKKLFKKAETHSFLS